MTISSWWWNPCGWAWGLRVAAFSLVFVRAVPTNAGTADDGTAAWERGDYATASTLLRRRADEGDPNAQYNLGVMYSNGLGVKTDLLAAERWYRLSAEQGFSYAQYNLGTLYAEGRGVHRNRAEAVRWFQLAADQGMANAQYYAASIYLEAGTRNLNRAKAMFEKAANRLPVGETRNRATVLGSLADKMIKNVAKAESGDVDMQYALAMMYGMKDSVLLDYHESAKWLKMSAERGHLEAQFHLGRIYFVGQGIAKDFVLAYQWMNIAAAGGHEKAAQTRDSIESFMTAEQIFEAQKLAREWKKSS